MTFDDLLNCDELSSMLAPGGPVSEVLTGFEERPQQLAMMQAVCQAFCRGEVLLVEAGTGVGKSLAYGLPAAEFVRLTDSRVVISTGTINLQEQLVSKDLPLLSRALGRDLDFVLVKGRQNYVCRRRLFEKVRQGVLLEQTERDSLVETLAGWVEHTEDGSRSDLETPVPNELWGELCSDADACLHRRCPQRDGCFFAQARRKAEDAEILVVNHHLLFADLALRSRVQGGLGRSVLPEYKHLILDEAHQLEAVASGFFGTQLSRTGVRRSLGRLRSHSRKQTGSLLTQLTEEMSALGAGLGVRGIRTRVDALVVETRQAFERAFDVLGQVVQEFSNGAVGRSSRLRLIPEVYGHRSWAVVEERFIEAGRLSERVADELDQTVSELLELTEENGRAVEVKAAVRRLRDMAAAGRHLMDGEGDGHVRWVESSRNSDSWIRLLSAPLDVAATLDAALFDPMHTVVLTSATLTVKGSFDFLAERLGVELQPESRRRALLVDSPFDYPKQARLALLQDAPEPNQAAFENWLPEVVLRSLRVSHGRGLVLFTAWGAMTRTFEAVRDDLEQMGIEALCQGQAPRDRLLERFRQNELSVLFGTDSFWQGVDVVGPALSNVVINRLPFDVPDEPLIQARVEQLEQEGKQPFVEFSLPRAVLRFKQGFGRLIRHRRDRGVVVVLDKRLLSKSYGRRFIESLPDVETVIGPTDEVLEQLQVFLEGDTN